LVPDIDQSATEPITAWEILATCRNAKRMASSLELRFSDI
jgi:hypothetical protein